MTKRPEVTVPQVGLPVRRRVAQARRCHSLGGRPFAQPVGALPFLGWSPASSLGDGRPSAPPLRVRQLQSTKFVPAFVEFSLTIHPGDARRGGPFTVLPRTQLPAVCAHALQFGFARAKRPNRHPRRGGDRGAPPSLMPALQNQRKNALVLISNFAWLHALKAGRGCTAAGPHLELPHCE